MVIKNASNAIKINYFLYRLKNVNTVLCKNPILMGNFVIHVRITHIGIFKPINVKVVLKIKYIGLDLKNVFALQVITEINLEIVLNVSLRCMLIRLRNYV